MEEELKVAASLKSAEFEDGKFVIRLGDPDAPYYTNNEHGHLIMMKDGKEVPNNPLALLAVFGMEKGVIYDSIGNFLVAVISCVMYSKTLPSFQNLLAKAKEGEEDPGNVGILFNEEDYNTLVAAVQDPEFVSKIRASLNQKEIDVLDQDIAENNEKTSGN